MLRPLTALALTLAALAATGAQRAEPTPTEHPHEKLLRALDDGRYVRARELATALVREDPRSVVGHFGLGVALHEGEGNLALALRHTREARSLLERGLPVPGDRGSWHEHLLFRELQGVADLGLHEEVLAVSRRIRALYHPDMHNADFWPLMKLGRIDEARAKAQIGISSDNVFEKVRAYNLLCALDGYPACKALLNAVRELEHPPGLALRNFGISAVEVGRFDEAERVLQEAVLRPSPATNPWRDLANLYLLEGRLNSAAEAARSMVERGRKMSRRESQYSRAEELTTSAMVLYLAGLPERALRATGAALAAPDRDARWSGSREEIVAETILLHRSLERTLAERAAEAASVLSLGDALSLRTRAIGLRLRAWRTGRRVLPLLLDGGLRPQDTAEQLEEPTLEGNSWLLLDAVELFGPGATRALVSERLAAPPAPDRSPTPETIRAAYLNAYETEARFLSGDAEGAAELAIETRAALPPGEVLLRARLAARAADALHRLGRDDEAYPLYQEVLLRDPGMLRRLGQALPIAPAPRGDSLVEQAARLVANSARFTETAGSPFAFGRVADRLCLVTRSGTQLGCATMPVQREPEERERADDVTWLPKAYDIEDPVRRLALSFLEEFFKPRITLMEADLNSLDGSPADSRGLDKRAIDLLTY